MSAPEPYDPDLDSATEVAKAVASHSADEDAQIPDWDDLSEEVQADLIELSRVAIKTFTGWLTAKGFRVLAPNVVPIPQSPAEAAAMQRAVQAFAAAQGRKRGLVGSVSPALVIPPGLKH